MPHTILNFVTEAPIANGSELVFAYPQGKSYERYQGASMHTLSFGSSFYRAPTDFTVLFDPEEIRVKWHGGTEVPGGRILTIQLDEPLAGRHIDERSSQIVPNLVRSQVFIVDLGCPSPVDEGAICRQKSFATMRKLPVDVAAFDPMRNVTITSHGAVEADMRMRVRGFDLYNRPMTEELLLQSDGTVAGQKCFRHVMELEVSHSTATPLSVGVGGALGFPMFMPGSGFVLRYFVNGRGLTGGVIIPGYENGAPTPTSRDLRGSFSAPDDVPLDGKNHFQLLVSLFNPSNIGVNEYCDFEFSEKQLPPLVAELDPTAQLEAPVDRSKPNTEVLKIIPPAR